MDQHLDSIGIYFFAEAIERLFYFSLGDQPIAAAHELFQRGQLATTERNFSSVNPDPPLDGVEFNILFAQCPAQSLAGTTEQHPDSGDQFGFVR